MRLICPNCGAQYEVDASMIPPEGRDVQCSSCAQTWFQEPEGAPASPPVPPDPTPESPNVTDETPVESPQEPVQSETDASSEQPSAPESEPESEPDDSPQELEDDLPQEPESVDAPDQVEAAASTTEEGPTEDEAPPLRKPSEQLEENILGILKEEAAREAQARREEEAAGLETQPDLGLESAVADSVRPGVAAHMARMRGSDEDDDSAAGSRSDLLPDIEEINSSLRPAAEHSEVKEVEDPAIAEGRQRKGFRFGFTLIILIVALLILAYVFAPQLTAQVPQAERFLIIYVDTANSMRDSIDQLLSRAIDGMSDGNGTGGDG